MGDEQQCYDQRREEDDKKPEMDVISHCSLVDLKVEISRVLPRVDTNGRI